MIFKRRFVRIAFLAGNHAVRQTVEVLYDLDGPVNDETFRTHQRAGFEALFAYGWPSERDGYRLPDPRGVDLPGFSSWLFDGDPEPVADEWSDLPRKKRPTPPPTKGESL